MGFTTYPILIAFSNVILDARCFLCFTSSSVYPNFLAVSSAISLPSTSLTGVAVIPNTFTFSFWLSNNPSIFPSHSLAPVLCNSSNTIIPYCSFITSCPLLASNPEYVSNDILGNISAIISSSVFPTVFCFPCTYFII